MDNVSVWGFSNRSSSLVVKDMSKELDSKVDKYGSEMHGDLNTNGNGILNIKQPVNDSDCVTKKYHDEGIGLLRNGVRSLRNNFINDFERIDRASSDLGSRFQLLFDRVSNVEISYISIETLVKVGNAVFLLQVGGIGSSSYFAAKLRLVETLYETVGKLYKDEIAKKLKQFENQKFVVDFRNEVMRAILDLSEGDFIRLKENLKENKLLNDVENRSVFTEVVNEIYRTLKPSRNYNELKLLAQKNLVLIQLGYIFIDDSLLNAVE